MIFSKTESDHWKTGKNNVVLPIFEALVKGETEFTSLTNLHVDKENAYKYVYKGKFEYLKNPDHLKQNHELYISQKKDHGWDIWNIIHRNIYTGQHPHTYTHTLKEKFLGWSFLSKYASWGNVIALPI